jgi:predicted Zn-dependent protease
MRFLRLLVASGALAWLLSGCASSTAPGAVGVTRSQLIVPYSAIVNEHAAQQYAAGNLRARSVGKLNLDAALTERVRGIAKRLIREVPTFRPDALGWGWEINVIDDPQLNATCGPGGKITVYTGIVRRLELTDDELAAVLGHEIAHALREHGREEYSQKLLAAGLVKGIADSNIRYSAQKAELVRLGADFLVLLPYSRSMELEADVMGLELMSRAGYDPAQAANVWRKMQGVRESGRPPEFFNTHPDHDRRIAELEAALPKVQPLFVASNKAVPLAGISSSVATPTSPVSDTSTTSSALEPPSSSANSLSGAVLTLAAQNSVRQAVRSQGTDGKDSAQIERMARDRGCNPNHRAALTAKGPGFELYTVQCNAEETWSLRCEFGQCRVLQ